MVSFAELFDNSEFINVDGNTARDFLKNRVRVWVEEQICVLKDRILVIEEGMLYDELVSVGNNQYVDEYDFLFGKLKFCEEMLVALKPDGFNSPRNSNCSEGLK